jgi:hypothetical protein
MIMDNFAGQSQPRAAQRKLIGLVTKETTAGGGSLPVLDQGQYYELRKICIILQTTTASTEAAPPGKSE